MFLVYYASSRGLPPLSFESVFALVIQFILDTAEAISIVSRAGIEEADLLTQSSRRCSASFKSVASRRTLK